MTIDGDARTTDALLRVWVDRLGGAGCDLPSGAPLWVDQRGSDAVVALRIEEAVVVAGPPEVVPEIMALRTERLLDIDAICRVTKPWGPEPIGTARIAVLGPSGVVGESPEGIVEVSREVIEVLASVLPSHEAEESGLLAMDRWWAVVDGSGVPLAASGFEVWDGVVAQMGVAVRPSVRGRGLGTDIARAACQGAVLAGLIPQWRSEISHEASRRTGAAIGFVDVGEQLAVAYSELGATR